MGDVLRRLQPIELHELDERPLHVKRKELVEAANWCCEAENDFVYGVEIPIPEDEAAWPGERSSRIPASLLQRAFRKVPKFLGTSWTRSSVKRCRPRSYLKLINV